MHKAFEDLTQNLSSLPGIGRRSASRIAFFLLKNETDLIQNLSCSLLELKEKLRFCRECGGISENEICEICKDSKRNNSLLCVIEEPGDIFVIENTHEFHGGYHVLMGALSPLDGIGPEDLRIQELLERIEKNPHIQEVFLATNPTVEGDVTANYINSLLTDKKDMKITRISHGISTGASIEFAENSTLAYSIRSRTIFKP